jgi:outer membrane lipoprotein-sorting protein
VTIDRMLDEYKITLTVEKLVLNQPLADDQFELKIPEGYKLQKMP